MQERGIEAFFFLDQSFPFLIRTSRQGEKRCAVRVSEFESIETALSLAGKIDWAWVDYFTRFPLSEADAFRLGKAVFRSCLVSPELQGFPREEVLRLKRLLHERGFHADAVCTKFPELWEDR